MSAHDHASSDDDSAPEAVSFETSKTENVEHLQRVKEQITSIRESQKKKRVERQEKYIEQKKKKFENLMLSDEVLDAIGDSCPDKIESSRKSVKDLKQNFSKKFDEDLTDTTLSDFIPLRTFSNYGVSVVNLAATNKKPLITSDKARSFKSIMYNRGVKRQTAAESIALSKKRKLVK